MDIVELFHSYAPSPKKLLVVVSGVSQVGKSTFIQQVAEGFAPDITFKFNEEEEGVLDLGWIRIDEEMTLFLLEYPNMFSLETILVAVPDLVIGAVVLAESVHVEGFRDSMLLIQSARDQVYGSYVIAVNKQDHGDAWAPEDLRFAMRVLPEEDIYPCVATEHETVRQVLLRLLDKVLNRV